MATYVSVQKTSGKKNHTLAVCFLVKKAIRETATNKATGLKVSDNDLKKSHPAEKEPLNFPTETFYSEFVGA